MLKKLAPKRIDSLMTSSLSALPLSLPSPSLSLSLSQTLLSRLLRVERQRGCGCSLYYRSTLFFPPTKQMAALESAPQRSANGLESLFLSLDVRTYAVLTLPSHTTTDDDPILTAEAVRGAARAIGAALPRLHGVSPAALAWWTTRRTWSLTRAM